MKNKIKFVAIMMLIILLIISLFNLSGCMFRPTMSLKEEYYSHEEFAKMIEHYNSVNNGSVDTFISFNLDNAENVSKSMYSFRTITNNKSLIKKYGFFDIYDEYYDVDQLCYINESKYRIGFHYDRNHTRQNITGYDIIEIKSSDKTQCNNFADLYYQENFSQDYDIFNPTYSCVYFYELYVNNLNCGCLHISSIDEASEEKLDEIIQILLDNIVIIDTEEK